MSNAAPAPSRPALSGVDHSARPTWRLEETVRFYRDVVGLPLVHAITARGWGPADHPDFLHFFFDSGRGSTIAFFYYLGTDKPDGLRPDEDYAHNATHTAWRVETREDLVRWKTHLESKGIEVSPYTRHEILESIYFTDPNGYALEITVRVRNLVDIDARDAANTIEAAISAERALAGEGRRIATIDQIWRAKGALLERGRGA
jgi:catechol 2,3-dioxygenase-like lactoylglutathione lyase family enzyme